jgi:hypothetical protein
LLATFAHHIVRIFLHGPYCQVSRVNTRSIIAHMHNAQPIWDGSIKHFIGHSVGTFELFAQSEEPIAVMNFAGSPLPAPVQAGSNLRKESHSLCFHASDYIQSDCWMQYKT